MAPSTKNLLLISSNAHIAPLLISLTGSAGFVLHEVTSLAKGLSILETIRHALVLVDSGTAGENWEDVTRQIRDKYPLCKLLLLHPYQSATIQARAMAQGYSGILNYPLQAGTALETIQSVHAQLEKEFEWLQAEKDPTVRSTRQESAGYETLISLSKSITNVLELDAALKAIVEAAVQLTNSEEGSILLKDEKTNDLFMVASKNIKDEFAKTFRLPVNDSLAGAVIQTGTPILMDTSTPQKIKTQYLVRSLIYVPLVIKRKTIGVLGVDNRVETGRIFTDADVKLLGILSEFASNAIQNARTHLSAIREKNKLESILTNIRDGILILDSNHHMMLANPVAMQAFGLKKSDLGKPVDQIIKDTELLELISDFKILPGASMEFTDGLENVFLVHVCEISDVGIGITMYDISHLKKLNQLKSDFVNNVSHDLRSPLTAILGYAELAERVGSVSDQQRDFLERIRSSVHDITNLIDHLLDLGKLESGLDVNREKLDLIQMVKEVMENYSKSIAEKKLTCSSRFSQEKTLFTGNRVQMREVIDNLFGNSVKYTPQGGRIEVSINSEDGQVIFRVADTGIGIPTTDLPRIFDKFFRASNAPAGIVGSGLGLSIVKNIVERHNGRIWLESSVGKGTAFTVVLPI